MKHANLVALLAAVCAAPAAGQESYSASESYAMFAGAHVGAVSRSTSETYAADVKLGQPASGQRIGSPSYLADTGTAAIDASLPAGEVLLFGLDPPVGDKEGGEPIRVLGFGLDAPGVPQVRLGGIPATGETIVSNTQISAVTAAGVDGFGNPRGAVDVLMLHSLGFDILDDGFVYAPALVAPHPFRVGSPATIDVHTSAGSFYMVWFGSATGFGFPVPPFEGSAVVVLFLIAIAPLQQAAADVASLTAKLADNPSLAGLNLNFQGLTVSSLAPVAGEFTNQLSVVIQP